MGARSLLGDDGKRARAPLTRAAIDFQEQQHSRRSRLTTVRPRACATYFRPLNQPTHTKQAHCEEEPGLEGRRTTEFATFHKIYAFGCLLSVRGGDFRREPIAPPPPLHIKSTHTHRARERQRHYRRGTDNARPRCVPRKNYASRRHVTK